MPDTPIDLSEGIQSVRLKVPTAEVPIPPEGFAQLHSPAPGELALRLPDGSVAPIGGGGGGGSDTITGDGGSVSTDATLGHDPGVVLSPVLGKTIWLNGPVVGPGENDPQAPDAVTLVERGAAPAPPPAGYRVYYHDGSHLRILNPDTGQDLSLGGGGTSQLSLGDGGVTLSNGLGPVVILSGEDDVVVGNGTFTLAANATGVTITTTGGRLILAGLPTADPAVAGQLWIAPITRQLMVSAG